MEVDADTALLFMGQRLNPPAAAVVMLDMTAVNKDWERLPFAIQDLLARLESPLLPTYGLVEAPPLDLNIQKEGYWLPVWTLE